MPLLRSGRNYLLPSPPPQTAQTESTVPAGTTVSGGTGSRVTSPAPDERFPSATHKRARDTGSSDEAGKPLARRPRTASPSPAGTSSADVGVGRSSGVEATSTAETRTRTRSQEPDRLAEFLAYMKKQANAETFKNDYRDLFSVVGNGYSPSQELREPIFNTVKHFLDDPKHTATLFNTAKHLIDLFPSPEQKVVSLGQSPAWVLEGCKMLDKSPERYDTVAFSEGWFDRFLKLEPDPQLTPERTQKYNDYLLEKKLSPTDIISSFRTTGFPVVLVEHTHSGKGLKSFLSVLLDRAKEEGCESQLKEALHVHILAGENMQDGHLPWCDPASLLIKSVGLTNGEFLVAMSNSDDSVDRLVPFYPPSKWDREPNYVECKAENIEKIKHHMESYLASRP
jgi:hypothetical protein